MRLPNENAQEIYIKLGFIVHLVNGGQFFFWSATCCEQMVKFCVSYHLQILANAKNGDIVDNGQDKCDVCTLFFRFIAIACVDHD